MSGFLFLQDGSTSLPSLLYFTNPSPNVGWEDQERMSILQRGPADRAFAVALAHHLAISKNLVLERLAAFPSNIGSVLRMDSLPSMTRK